jgi:hypothetical protein
MTVEDMIAQLQALDPKAKVVFHYTSADHWGTQIADPVREISEAKVEWSSYHNTFKVAKNEEFYPFDEDGNPLPDEDFEPEETVAVIAIGESDARSLD